VKARLANAAWLASCRPEWLRFARAADRLRATQEQLLLQYLRTNARTEYGVQNRFAAIHSVREYQSQVPLTSYTDYEACMRRIGEGVPRVLTAESVRLFEVSSGSASASKLIPYTGRLRSEFHRGIAPWIHNLYTNVPAVQGGTAYWSVTPLIAGKAFTSGGVPIGFESDSAYLGPLGQWLGRTIMAVPDSVKYAADVDAFRYATLFHLLHHPDLCLISVWNPTFLTLLLEPLAKWWASLVEDIGTGCMRPPHAEAPTASRYAPDPALARRLGKLGPAEYGAIWPALAVISCWADGASTPYVRRVAERFPGVMVQGKGLLATEAFVSLPLVGVNGGVLAANSHFFEFIDEAGEAHLAHQLAKGRTYSVVITTGGGLYRYRLYDVVEITGHWKELPCLRFVGKEDHVSDWFGEKLEEHFVSQALQRVFEAHEMDANFAMLAPEDMQDRAGYVLYVECGAGFDAPNLALAVDAALRSNFHYDYCRKLGQLEPVRIARVKDGVAAYLRACQQRGQKLGNIKPAVLQQTTGWRTLFELQTGSTAARS
jgi:hypothetical protein